MFNPADQSPATTEVANLLQSQEAVTPRDGREQSSPTPTTHDHGERDEREDRDAVFLHTCEQLVFRAVVLAFAVLALCRIVEFAVNHVHHTIEVVQKAVVA